MPTRRRTFGAIRKLPSGRWQAHYTGPDGAKHNAPTTFLAKGDANAWLSKRQSEIVDGAWMPPTTVEPTEGPTTLSDYFGAWLAARPLKPRTAAEYRALFDGHIAPTLGGRAVAHISPAAVRSWYAAVSAATGPTRRAHAYSLLRTILTTAVDDELLAANPCRIRGAGSAKRVKQIRPASLPELAALVEAIPPRYEAMVLLAAWCGLRFGELTELRRKDVDVKGQRLRVRRRVVLVDGERLVDSPKSEAGIRDVAIPPHLMPMVSQHLAEHTRPGREALLFPAADGASHMAPASLYRVWYRAREHAGRPDLRFHDLRHTGATLAAATGATLAELMARLGHSTPQAAMRYQHAAADRDAVIAAALSKMAEDATVTSIDAAPTKRVRAATPRR